MSATKKQPLNAWPDVSGSMVPWGPNNSARATKLGDTEIDASGQERYVTVNGHYVREPQPQPIRPGPRPNRAKFKNRTLIVSRLYARDGRRCWWCGMLMLPIDEVERFNALPLPRNFPTVDHLTPRSLGGGNRLDNLVVACSTCNHERGDTPATLIPIPGRVVVQSVECPDCTDGVWKETDGRVCVTCNGAGELSAERATELFTAARKKIRGLYTNLHRERAKVHALERVIEDELGPQSSRRDLATLAQNRREIIRNLADRVLTLKVELAEATGADLARLIPFERERERALRLLNPH